MFVDLSISGENAQRFLAGPGADEKGVEGFEEAFKDLGRYGCADRPGR